MSKTICPFYSFCQAMTKVYSKCYDEIGAFNDTRYIVGMLEKVISLALSLPRVTSTLFVQTISIHYSADRSCEWRQILCHELTDISFFGIRFSELKLQETSWGEGLSEYKTVFLVAFLRHYVDKSLWYFTLVKAFNVFESNVFRGADVGEWCFVYRQQTDWREIALYSFWMHWSKTR